MEEVITTTKIPVMILLVTVFMELPVLRKIIAVFSPLGVVPTLS